MSDTTPWRRYFYSKRSRLRYLLSRKKWKKVFTYSEPEARFSEIYRSGLWRGSESRSGFGSGKKYTESIRTHLPRLIEANSIKTIFDAACGDFNWMKSVILDLEVSYLGVDIVSELIQRNNRLYKSKKVNFAVLDLTKDPIPQSDLIICRDVLFHLANKEIFATLHNLVASKSRYFLITSHVPDESYKNEDIETGDFRRVDLFGDPFFLPKNAVDCFVDYINPDPPRYMYLFSHEQLSHWRSTTS